MRPKAVDLFAGAGGLSLGLEMAGFDVTAAVEIDPVHAAVHAYNFPQTRMFCRDVCDIRSGELDAEGVDLVAGGAPCQGFSLIGKRNLDDPRNRLVQEFLRVVRDLRPRCVLFENVKGITVGQHKAVLLEFVEDLQKAGYTVDWGVFTASDYGVPQKRERVFVFGSLDGDVSGARPRKFPEAPTVKDALGDLPDADAFPELAERDWAHASKNPPQNRYQRIMRGLEKASGDFHMSRALSDDMLTSSMRTKHTRKSIERFAATPPGQVEKVSRFLRLHPDGLCNTLRAGTDKKRGAHTAPRPIHPTLDRVITVREAARLHSIPDWFRLHRTKWQGFRQIGNSVPPMMAWAIGSMLRRTSHANDPEVPSGRMPLGNEETLTWTESQADAFWRASGR